VSRLRIAGLLLLLGGAITLTLHAAGAPEALLDYLYDTLLSGLEVPPDPSPTARDIVSYVSLVGGIVEIAAGAALLLATIAKGRSPSSARDAGFSRPARPAR
jgi:hypothetical protein